jgi:hypothetical protein
MKNLQKVVLSLLSLIALVLILFFITNSITKYTGYSVSGKSSKIDDFKKCIKENKIILYINSNDIVSTIDKIQLKDYSEDINIFNCMRNNQYCIDESISNFPTWIINNKKIESDISLERLQSETGCTLAK